MATAVIRVAIADTSVWFGIVNIPSAPLHYYFSIFPNGGLLKGRTWCMVYGFKQEISVPLPLMCITIQLFIYGWYSYGQYLYTIFLLGTIYRVSMTSFQLFALRIYTEIMVQWCGRYTFYDTKPHINIGNHHSCHYTIGSLLPLFSLSLRGTFHYYYCSWLYTKILQTVCDRGPDMTLQNIYPWTGHKKVSVITKVLNDTKEDVSLHLCLKK